MAQVASELISITNNEKLADSKYIKDLELGDKKQSDINKDSLSGGVYNVTKLHPMQSGYYTLSTAIAAVPQALQSIGMVITYQTGENSWETKQFKGVLSDFTDESKWEDFGGGGETDSYEIYDVSGNHSNTPYSSLSSALAAIPTNDRKAGMNIKFIQTVNPTYEIERWEFRTSPSASEQAIINGASDIELALPIEDGILEASEITSGYTGTDKATIDSAISSLSLNSSLKYRIQVGEGASSHYVVWIITKASNASTQYSYWSCKLSSYTNNTNGNRAFTNVTNWMQNGMGNVESAYIYPSDRYFEAGLIDNTSGADWNLSGFFRTGYIKIQRVDLPFFVKGTTDNVKVPVIAFYDGMKRLLRLYSNLGSSGVEYKIATPKLAVYFRSSTSSANLSNTYVKQIINADNDYSQFKETAEKQETDSKLNSLYCDTFTLNGGINNNGTVSSIAGYGRTDYLPINDKNQITARGLSDNSQLAFIAFYDKDKNFISYVGNLGSNTARRNVTPPAGAAFCRMSVKVDTYDTCFIMQDGLSLSQLSDKFNSIEQNYEDINLASLVSIVDGEYILNGSIKSLANHSHTNYIRVDDSLTYKLVCTIGTSANAGYNLISCFSDIDGKPNSYLGGIVKSSSSSYTYNGVYELPQGTKYVIVSDDVAASSFASKLYCSFNDYIRVLSKYHSLQVTTPAKLRIPKYFDVANNLQCDVFIKDAIENVHELPYILSMQGTDLGGEHGHIRITQPTGNTSISLKTYTDRYFNMLIGSKSFTLRSNARTGGSGTYNVLVIGDSLVERGPTAAEMYKLLADDGDVTINQIGTKTQVYGGVTYRHEGYSGNTWNAFITSSSPFYFNGGISFTTYMQTHFPSLSGIDCAFILLGTNDNISLVEPNSKQLINALVRDYPNCKIAIGIPAKGSARGNVVRGFDYYSFGEKINFEAELYLRLYDNGNYKPNVTCIAQGIWIDRENDYPYNESNVTPYSSVKTKVYTDNWHPKEQGYRQWGRALYCKMRAWISGNL